MRDQPAHERCCDDRATVERVRRLEHHQPPSVVDDGDEVALLVPAEPEMLTAGVEEIEPMILDGRIKDAKSIAALLVALRYLLP